MLQNETSKTVPSVNGKFLYYAFLAGGNRILQHQAEINHINVFPVNDKDTGTNMASTVRWVMDNIQPDRSYKTTLQNIADEALKGARGNSGVIFAQFLHGLNNETLNKPLLTLTEFAESVKNSIPYIYEAIANPVEGTMLTVIREWSEFLNAHKHAIYDFTKVISSSMDVLEKSLDETTEKLKILNNTGFVDAGAKGFVLFLQGIIQFMHNGNVRKLMANQEPVSLIHTEDLGHENINYRYCTEAIIKNLNTSKDDLQKKLKDRGDSVVIAGSDKTCRIHVHTSKPADLFEELQDFGTISYQKVDDMVRQQETVNNRKWNIALVTDSTCDLSEELLEKYQVNMVPINLNFGENHYLDKVTIQPKQFYHLLDKSEDFPKTAQINEQAFTNLYSHLASHYDAIIAIHLTEKFSGTCENSRKAAKRITTEFKKPVYVIDSKNLSGALGLLVLNAAELIEEGYQASEVAEKIEKAVEQAKVFVSVRDLKYMIKGGRVSKPKGMIASALGLNPVISMDEDGNSLLFGKTFSQRSSLKKVVKHIQKISKDKDIWNYIVLHAHHPELAAKVETQMEEIAGKKAVSVVDISPVIGMHAGVGSVAVSLLFNA